MDTSNVDPRRLSYRDVVVRGNHQPATSSNEAVGHRSGNYTTAQPTQAFDTSIFGGPQNFLSHNDQAVSHLPLGSQEMQGYLPIVDQNNDHVDYPDDIEIDDYLESEAWEEQNPVPPGTNMIIPDLTVTECHDDTRGRSLIAQSGFCPHERQLNGYLDASLPQPLEYGAEPGGRSVSGAWSWSQYAEHHVEQTGTRHGEYGYDNTTLDSQGRSVNFTRQFSQVDAKTSQTSPPPRSTAPQVRNGGTYAEAARRGSSHTADRAHDTAANRRRGRLSRLSIPEGALSLNVPSPTPSVYSSSSYTPTILQCHDAGCHAEYTGKHRRGSMARHMRLKHGVVEKEYPCGACRRSFKRQDARLKHYRKAHPELNVAAAVPRK